MNKLAGKTLLEILLGKQISTASLLVEGVWYFAISSLAVPTGLAWAGLPTHLAWLAGMMLGIGGIGIYFEAYRARMN